MKARLLPAGDPATVHEAAAILRDGGLVALPTETVYGLGAHALDPRAVARIFVAKQRPFFDPLIVHLAGATELANVADLSFAEADSDREYAPDAAAVRATIALLAERFWPGPLTLVLPRAARVPAIVTADLETVAVRVPASDVTRAILRELGAPVAAPSANPFGYVSPTRAEHVAAQLGEVVDAIVDDGPCAIGVESTILDLTGARPRLLRPGGVTVEALRSAVGEIETTRGTAGAAPVAPGALASHYAPRTPFVLLRDRLPPLDERAGAALLVAMGRAPEGGSGYARVLELSPRGDAAESAAGLFAAIRTLDTSACLRIDAFPCDDSGLGRAILDRLRRAAGRGLEPDL